MQPISKREILEYRIHYQGIFGKNRSRKSDNRMLVETCNRVEFEIPYVRELAAHYVSSLKFKGPFSYQVSVSEVTVEKFPDYETRSEMAFESKRLFTMLVKQGEENENL